jgi:DeoR/GlpR family transcriptional regulator of sugar metabolism
MADYERLDQIRRYIEQNHNVQVAEISKLLGVSVATARRDLDQLAEIGEIQRTHGGARLIQKAPPEPPVMQRTSEQEEEKQRIAKATAELVDSGDTLLMGGGSTVYHVAKQLSGKQDVTVVTNSLLVIDTLANYTDIQLVILGGFMRHSELVFYGHMTEMALDELYADKVIFGVRAISVDRGLTLDFMPELSTDRKILTKGREIIVVADYTKFDRQSPSLVAPISIVDKIITDDKAPANTINELREMGIEVIVV